MHRLYYILFILHLSIQAQTKLTQDISSSTSFIGIDYLDHFYYLKNNTLIKKSKNSKLQYANIALGNITNVDITNPFEIVVYYHDFNIAIILDRSLNKIDTIDFFGKNIGFATKATTNKLWLYNIETQKIELYNYRTDRTELTSEIVFKEAPKQFKSNFNHVYVLTQNNTLLDFDSFLNSKVISEGIEIDAFSTDQKQLVIQQKNIYFDISEGKSKKIFQIDGKTPTSFYLKDNTLFIFDGNEIQSVIIPKID